LLVAAANPCRCGHFADPARACARAPQCGADYMGRLSGPLMDRFDLRIEVPPVAIADLDRAASGETTTEIAGRISAARDVQARRFAGQSALRVNADATGPQLEEIAEPDEEGRSLIQRAADRLGLSARGYHRILRTARTIADLDGSDRVRAPHLAEAIGYRLPFAAAA
ncbi:magnesium chelatase subunit ChlI family protein, partial [Paracoccus sphaerophysae]